MALVSAGLCAPFTHSILWFGDEGVVMRGADQILQGRVLYRDFFEFIPPGSFILTAAWLELFGNTLFAGRVMTTVLVSTIATLTYSICFQASRDKRLSAAIALLWVVSSQGVWTQVSHHWFSVCLATMATWAILKVVCSSTHQIRWMVVAGGASGLAGMTTPTMGALTMAAAMVALLGQSGRWTKLAWFVAAGSVAPLILVGWTVWQGAIRDAWFDVIVVTGSRYTSIQPVPFGFGFWSQGVFLVAMFPATGLLALLAIARGGRQCLRDPMFLPCSAFAVAAFMLCFPRPDVAHIGYVLPLDGPLFAWSVVRVVPTWPRAVRGIAGAMVGLTGLLTVLTYGLVARNAQGGVATRTAHGMVNIVDPLEGSELVARITGEPPDDTFFFYPYMPLLPYLTARGQVAREDLFTPQFTLPVQYAEACLAVTQRATWVVIDRAWTDPQHWKAHFPSITDADPTETASFERSLERGFDLVERIGTFELRHRRPDTSDALCEPVTD